MIKTKFRTQLDPYYPPPPGLKHHEVTACNLCGAKGFSPWKRVGPWTVVKCVDCGLCFLSPRPDAAELYADYHRRLHIEDAPTPEDVQRGVAAWDNRVEFISRFKTAGRALDLGCASGFLLANLRNRGWDVMGCELADWAAQRARDLFGIPVITGDILTTALPQRPFDLVTLWDVIEHVPDPAAVLAKARTAAKPDGLVVIRVPNVASLDARCLGTRWIDWCLPFHFYHFTPKVLAALAERQGLAVRHLETGVSTVLWRFLFAPLAIPPHHVKLLARLERAKPFRGIQRAFTDNPVYRNVGARFMPGPTITLVAQPR
jgi:SAM-dependent methyltransferase